MLHNLLLHVPGEKEHIIETGLFDIVRMINWDMGTGKKLPLFIRITIYGVIKEISTNFTLLSSATST